MIFFLISISKETEVLSYLDARKYPKKIKSSNISLKYDFYSTSFIGYN